MLAEGFAVPPTHLRTFHWVHAARAARVFVLEEDGEIVATGGGISFGATGWIGGIVTRESARGRGLGSAMTAHVAEWLRARGAGTVMLFATAAGRPVYERLGFVAEAEGATFELPERGREIDDHVRPLALADFEDVLRLDRAASGEDRTVAIESGFPVGWCVRRGEALVGAAVAGPFGPAHAVAADEVAGRALLRAAVTVRRWTVPVENEAAVDMLRELGGEEAFRAVRMRLGDPLAWRPTSQWGAFNPFWG